MDTSTRARFHRPRWTPLWRLIALIAVTTGLAAESVGVGGRSEPAIAPSPASALQAPAKGADSIRGMASLSGTVTAPQPFTVAQVYIRNEEKRMVYMVYATNTNAGRFRAVALFPGNYEVSAVARGPEWLESDVQKLVVKAGDTATMKLALREGPGPSPSKPYLHPEQGRSGPTLQSYDQIYPPGPGRDVAERTCIACHGENFLPERPGSAEWWRQEVDIAMMGVDLWNRPSILYPEGLLSFRNTAVRFSREDHKVLMDYLLKNFGPNARPRAVRSDRQPPVDETQLGKALFIEYYLPPDPPGQHTQAPEWRYIGYRGRRVGQDVRFDADGNVWLAERGFPHRLAKLDPRTGEQKDYVLEEPMNGIHDMLIDREGIVWLPQHQGLTSSKAKHLLGFNPKTEKWQYKIPGDPENVIRNPIKWMQSIALDSKGNVYAGWIMGGALTKWDRAANKVSVFPSPTPNSIYYGVVIDRNDNIWAANYMGKLTKFDTTVNQFTEFTPVDFPNQMRRPNVDSQNNVWVGIWAAGNRPGKILKLDQTTGRFTQFAIPWRAGQPYDVCPDPEGNIWFADSPTPDKNAGLGRVNPRDGTFTFYPRPQFGADTPKIQITRDGAVWYSPRGSTHYPGYGVLYPDMDKITTLAAYYKYGPPGYWFDVKRITRAGSGQ